MRTNVMSRCIYVIAIHNCTKCAVILYTVWMERMREIPTEVKTSTQNLGANKHIVYTVCIYLGGTRMLHYIIIRTTCYCMMVRVFLLTMHTFSSRKQSCIIVAN